MNISLIFPLAMWNKLPSWWPQRTKIYINVIKSLFRSLCNKAFDMESIKTWQKIKSIKNIWKIYKNPGNPKVEVQSCQLENVILLEPAGTFYDYSKLLSRSLQFLQVSDININRKIFINIIFSNYKKASR